MTLDEGERGPTEAGAQEEDKIVIEIVPGPMVGPVLGRIVGILASRAGMGVDRVTEALALAESLGAHSEEVSGKGTFRVVADAGTGSLDLCVGPVEAGDASRLLKLETHPGLGSVIEQLADEVRVGDRGGEVLEIRLGGGPRTGSVA